MTISKKQEGKNLYVALDGRLDVLTSSELQKELGDLADIENLELDLEKLSYISSAGLRVLVSAQQSVSKSGKMTIKNVCSSVMHVFEITGLADNVFNIE